MEIDRIKSNKVEESEKIKKEYIKFLTEIEKYKKQQMIVTKLKMGIKEYS